MAKFVNVADLSATLRSPTLIQCEVLATDASATFQLPIKAGTQIHKVAVFVTKQFSGSPNMTIGRASAQGVTSASYGATAYFTNAAIALGTEDTAPNVSAVAPFVSFYDATLAASSVAVGDEYLTVTWTSTGSSTATGRILIYVELSHVLNDGILPTIDGLAKTVSPWA